MNDAAVQSSDSGEYLVKVSSVCDVKKSIALCSFNGVGVELVLSDLSKDGVEESGVFCCAGAMGTV